jgi:hypothetical protein
MATASALECGVSATGWGRRRNFLVYRRFQLRLALLLAACVFLACVILSFVLYGVLHQQARLRMMAPETYTAEVPLVAVGFALAFALIAGGGLGLWCVIATHRVCGPLILLRHYFDELAAGRFPVMRPLRRHDDADVRDLHAAFARALRAIESRCREVKTCVSQTASSPTEPQP